MNVWDKNSILRSARSLIWILLQCRRNIRREVAEVCRVVALVDAWLCGFVVLIAADGFLFIVRCRGKQWQANQRTVSWEANVIDEVKGGVALSFSPSACLIKYSSTRLFLLDKFTTTSTTKASRSHTVAPPPPDWPAIQMRLLQSVWSCRRPDGLSDVIFGTAVKQTGSVWNVVICGRSRSFYQIWNSTSSRSFLRHSIFSLCCGGKHQMATIRQTTGWRGNTVWAS